MEEIQAFTSQWVPYPGWVKVDHATISPEMIAKAAHTLVDQLGPTGIDKIGGRLWWRWRQTGSELRAEWIEMRADYNERKLTGGKARRVMLYVHGGAYFFGSVDEHRYQMQRHARKLRARVFAPRYRLAPQFPFPCGLQDCLAAYFYLLSVQEPGEIILAGDSAGGGMIISILVTLRDQGLPLPAGAVLISPWVDLTHSFPSVAGTNQLDYIPSHGFMQKPSPSWPPPNDDEMEHIAKGQTPTQLPETDAVPGFAIQEGADNSVGTSKLHSKADIKGVYPGHPVAGAGRNLSLEVDGKLVVLKDQIQMYTTNQLLSHPLVSPVLQPSLGGLPPLLILTGGGEVLRDEQIYLAHKAARPDQYVLSDIYQAEYDPKNEILNKYKPTDVQLQVWDDLCHVAPTLSFTRPAKFMYRSIAQFGAWALAHVQRRSIEIPDDDDDVVSIISSGSNTDSSSSSDLRRPHIQKGAAVAEVGKAGDPLPPFENHMIRQCVDRHGIIYPMAPESEIPALQMPASDVGVIKRGPVLKWLAAKKQWDTRYASAKRRVQNKRVQELMDGGFESFGEGERPPPSALAGRRRKVGLESDLEKKKKKSWGMTLWSLWGSKHDESTIKREEEMVDEERAKSRGTDGAVLNGGVDAKDRPRATSTGSRSRRTRTRTKSTTNRESDAVDNDVARSRNRRKTVTVTDQGQATTLRDPRHEQQASDITPDSDQAIDIITPNPSVLSPTYSSNTNNLSRHHLDPTPTSDTGSISTTTTNITSRGNPDVGSDQNASTTALYHAPCVIKPRVSSLLLAGSAAPATALLKHMENDNGEGRATATEEGVTKTAARDDGDVLGR